MQLSRFDNSSFDRGACRVKEAAWILCKALCFLVPLPLPSAFRVFCLRLFGAKIGAGMVIRSGVNITFPWRFAAGDHVWIGEGVLILSLAEVTLGSDVCLSQRSFLCTGSHDRRKESFDLIARPIVIGDQVWVAAQAFVGPGVTVGRGATLAAGTVVTRSVPEKALVRGNPAQVTVE